MNATIKVEFDPGGIETLMQMWRESPELLTSDEDEFNFQKMDAQLALLRNYQRSAEGWHIMLLSMAPLGDDLPLTLLREKVAAFDRWAREEIANIETLHAELKFLYQEKK